MTKMSNSLPPVKTFMKSCCVNRKKLILKLFSCWMDRIVLSNTLLTCQSLTTAREPLHLSASALHLLMCKQKFWEKVVNYRQKTKCHRKAINSLYRMEGNDLAEVRDTSLGLTLVLPVSPCNADLPLHRWRWWWPSAASRMSPVISATSKTQRTIHAPASRRPGGPPGITPSHGCPPSWEAPSALLQMALTAGGGHNTSFKNQSCTRGTWMLGLMTRMDS